MYTVILRETINGTKIKPVVLGSHKTLEKAQAQVDGFVNFVSSVAKEKNLELELEHSQQTRITIKDNCCYTQTYVLYIEEI